MFKEKWRTELFQSHKNLLKYSTLCLTTLTTTIYFTLLSPSKSVRNEPIWDDMCDGRISAEQSNQGIFIQGHSCTITGCPEEQIIYVYTLPRTMLHWSLHAVHLTWNPLVYRNTVAEKTNWKAISRSTVDQHYWITSRNYQQCSKTAVVMSKVFHCHTTW